jgi:TonB family protein
MNTITYELLRAVADGDINRVRALLVTGADPNSTNNANQTALMLAAAFKRSDIIGLLINAGASLDAEDELGLAAIDWANNDAEILALLNAVSERQTPAPVAEQVIVTTTIEHPPAPRATGTERIPDAPALTGLAAAILRDHKPKASSVAAVNVVVEKEPEPESEAESVPDTQYLPVESIPFSTDDTLDKKVNSTAVSMSDETLAPTASRSSRGRIFAIDSTYDAPEPRRKVEIAVPGAPKKGGAGKLIGALTLVVVLVVIAFGVYSLVKYLFAQPLSVTSTPPVTNTSPVPTPSVVQTANPVKSAPLVGGALVGTELHLADAEYPPGAKQSGAVTVKIRVSQKGIVVAANAVAGDQTLRSAAERAARNSAFSPDELEGKGTFTEGTITYTFVAPQGESALSRTVVRNEVTVTTGGPLAGTERKLVKPEYPASARRDGISGTVTLVVRVNGLGRVVSWRPLDGQQDLRAAAVKVVRDSIFVPAKHRANTEVVGTITYTFR